MQDLLIVEIIDCKSDLGYPIEDLGLIKVLALLLHLLDAGMHVSELTVDHDDAEVALLVGEGVFIGDDIDVPELLEDLELILDVFPLLIIHFEYLDAFKRIVIALVGDVLAQKHVS
jgi:hypothetical protein